MNPTVSGLGGVLSSLFSGSTVTAMVLMIDMGISLEDVHKELAGHTGTQNGVGYLNGGVDNAGIILVAVLGGKKEKTGAANPPPGKPLLTDITPLGAIALALISVLVTAADPKARHHTDSRVCFDLMLYLFATGITLWISFHWIIVVLYFLELALCIYFWRKK